MDKDFGDIFGDGGGNREMRNKQQIENKKVYDKTYQSQPTIHDDPENQEYLDDEDDSQVDSDYDNLNENEKQLRQEESKLDKIKRRLYRDEERLFELCKKFKFSLSRRGIYKHIENAHGIREIWEDDWYDSFTEPWESKWYVMTWKTKESRQQISLWFQSECEECKRLFYENKKFFNNLDSKRLELIKSVSNLKKLKIDAIQQEQLRQQELQADEQELEQLKDKVIQETKKK